MCDTMAVVGPEGVLFAKNSDRDPNEAQVLEWHPRRAWPAEARLQATHIDVPQVRETHAVLLSRPYWMWGAEMGANEHGVTIGNEAVFTTQPLARTGLTGMDLLRLALERADSARAAVEVITALLEAHGQGGGCGHENRNFTYHNSFIVADPRTAYVLETAGKHWAVEQIHGARSISNGLTIPGFAEKYSDRLKTTVSACRARRARTTAGIATAQGPGDLMRVLRDHGDAAWPVYSPLNGAMSAPCAHAGGLVAATQTTASWVADLRGAGPHTHWVTATAAPCVSLFKPVQVARPVEHVTPQTDRLDDSLWWQHERLHRRMLRAPTLLSADYLAERDAIEAEWLAESPDSAGAFAKHREWLGEWNARLDAHGAVADTRPWFVRRYWRQRNQLAGIAGQ